MLSATAGSIAEIKKNAPPESLSKTRVFERDRLDRQISRMTLYATLTAARRRKPMR
jgi:hypothetical protein